MRGGPSTPYCSPCDSNFTRFIISRIRSGMCRYVFLIRRAPKRTSNVSASVRGEVSSKFMASPTCPKLSGCAFFNDKLKRMPAVAEMTKNSYCRSSRHTSCARFIVANAHGPAGVPADLYPDQQDRVATLLDAKGK